MPGERVTTATLAKDRLELALADAKPVYSHGEARAEAERCLNCHDAPCIKACPTEIDIPTFIKKIASGNVRGAARTIFTQNILGYSCARVCPVEVLCVGSCVYNEWHRAPIQIGKLQRFATEGALARPALAIEDLRPRKAPNGKRVALVGAGPASLACAAYLALEGTQAVMFERASTPGGLNTTGVAPYKLHAEDSLHEADWVLALGAELRAGVAVGRDVRGADLLRDYDAVFIGVGLGADTWLGIPGEQGPGVAGATALIARIKNEPGFRLEGVERAVIVGGGNTAIDVARELSQLGVRDVAMVYRRTGAEMPGYRHEMDAARRERVRLVEHAQPVEVVRKSGAVSALRVAQTRDGATLPGTEWDLPCELVVLAIGQAKLPEIAREFPGVELDRRGCVVADARTRRTGNPRVYAGGDCVNGGMEVVNAAADGREAAREMLRGWGLSGTAG